MAVVRGTSTVITLSGLSGPASGSHDLSAFVDTSQWSLGSDIVDITTFGKLDHVVTSALKKGTFSMGGVYDSTLPNNPWFVHQQANGQTTTIALKPEGTGTGKPTHTFSAVLDTYNQSAPVADMVRWDSSWTVSDAVTSSIQ